MKTKKSAAGAKEENGYDSSNLQRFREIVQGELVGRIEDRFAGLRTVVDEVTDARALHLEAKISGVESFEQEQRKALEISTKHAYDELRKDFEKLKATCDSQQVDIERALSLVRDLRQMVDEKDAALRDFSRIQSKNLSKEFSEAHSELRAQLASFVDGIQIQKASKSLLSSALREVALKIDDLDSTPG